MLLLEDYLVVGGAPFLGQHLPALLQCLCLALGVGRSGSGGVTERGLGPVVRVVETFLVGFPEEASRYVRRLRKLQKRVRPGAHLLTFLPFTPPTTQSAPRRRRPRPAAPAKPRPQFLLPLPLHTQQHVQGGDQGAVPLRARPLAPDGPGRLPPAFATVSRPITSMLNNVLHGGDIMRWCFCPSK